MSTVLQTIVEQKHYRFISEEVTWQEAVRLSALSLVEDGTVSDTYYQSIVSCIEKYGPYVVFENYIAMPHTQENAEGAYKTGIGFMVSEKIVDFGVDEFGDKKEAKLFFTLSSTNPDEHMENMMQLMGIFQNVPLLEALMKAKTPEDILAAEAAYPCEEE